MTTNNYNFTYGGQEYSCYIESIEEYLNNPTYEIMVNFREGAEIYTKYRTLGIGYDTIALLDDSGEVIKHLDGMGDGRFYPDDKGDTDVYHEAQVIVWNKETEDVEAEAVLGFIGDADYLFPAVSLK